MTNTDPKEYYCDTCLRVHHKLIWMDRVTKPPYGYICPECGRSECINQGNARHYAAEQLKSFQDLATRLGVPAIWSSKGFKL